jgi:hypothetical protein
MMPHSHCDGGYGTINCVVYSLNFHQLPLFDKHSPSHHRPLLQTHTSPHLIEAYSFDRRPRSRTAIMNNPELMRMAMEQMNRMTPQQVSVRLNR